MQTEDKTALMNQMACFLLLLREVLGRPQAHRHGILRRPRPKKGGKGFFYEPPSPHYQPGLFQEQGPQPKSLSLKAGASKEKEQGFSQGLEKAENAKPRVMGPKAFSR